MAEIIINLLGTVLWIIEGFFLYQILCDFVTPRSSRMIKLLGWVLISLVVTVIVYPNDPVNITLVFLVFAAVMAIVFRGKWYIKLSMLMILYPIIIALNYVWNDFTGNLFFTLIGGYDWKNNLFATCSSILPVAFWWIFRKVTAGKLSKIQELLDIQSWLCIDIICLASLVAVFSCVFYTPFETYKIYPCMLACIATNMGSIRLAAYLADRIKADMDMKNLRVLQEYYEELEKNHLQIRKLRHDMNSHLSAIGGLLQAGDADGALSYSRELTGYMDTGNRPFCQNGIINALLNVKYNLAIAAEIDCFFHISIDSLLSIDDIHLCTILANTLDNSIGACLKIPDKQKRKLSVRARHTENGYFSYEISNSKQNQIQEKKGLFTTDKEDKKRHGLGISSVREAVNHYRGTMDISYTDNEFQIIILISAN